MIYIIEDINNIYENYEVNFFFFQVIYIFSIKIIIIFFIILFNLFLK